MNRFYHKKRDEALLARIKEIIKERPSYGYKRVCALLNRSCSHRVNKKRVYRVMKINGLCLAKGFVKRAHVPTGKVMTLHSNTRWCSDCFEIKCLDGTKVYVAFSLDTCDREVISFVAKTRAITKKDIQNLMCDSVFKRFSSYHAPIRVQWLSDRGSVYKSEQTRALARSLNLDPCMTRAYSPESNGMAEALVKTIKRDNYHCQSSQ